MKVMGIHNKDDAWTAVSTCVPFSGRTLSEKLDTILGIVLAGLQTLGSNTGTHNDTTLRMKETVHTHTQRMQT